MATSTDAEQARRIIDSLRQAVEANPECPARLGAATSVGDPNIDSAVDAVNAGALTISALGETELSPTGAIQLLAEIGAARNRLDAAFLRTIAVVDQFDVAPTSGLGARTTADLVKKFAAVSPGRAKANVAAAHALHGGGPASGGTLVPATTSGEAPLGRLGVLLADGEITTAHVDTAVRTLAKLPTEILDAVMAPSPEDIDEVEDDEPAKFEPKLVRERIANYFARKAPATRPDDLRKLAHHLVEVLDPDTDDHFDPDAFSRRSMTIGTDITGMVFGTYQLDAVAGAKLRAILDPLSAPRPAQSDENGNVALRDDRSPAQRRADGLMELVEAASGLAGQAVESHDSDGRPTGSEAPTATDAAHDLFGLIGGADGSIRPSQASRLRPGRRPARVTIVTTAEKLAGTDRTPSHCHQVGQIGPGTLTRMVCEATFERLVMNADGAVLNLGAAVRLASPAQRRAVSVRDMGCAFPGCDRPPTWCDVHHVLWYSHGGPTDVGNLCLLCECHHTLVHTGQWEMTMIRGVPYARPGPQVITVKVRGKVAKAYGTREVEGKWVRNSYFDELKAAEGFARSIIDSAPDPSNPLGQAGLLTP